MLGSEIVVEQVDREGAEDGPGQGAAPTHRDPHNDEDGFHRLHVGRRGDFHLW